MAVCHGVTVSCGGGRADASAKSMFSKFRSFSTEITSQLLTQLLSDAVEPTLHGAGRQTQLGGDLGGGLAVPVFAVEQRPLIGGETRQRGGQLLLALPAQQGILGAAVAVGQPLVQGDVLRVLGAETAQGAVPRQNRQPCAEAAALSGLE